jgi:hypothetical protein
MNGPSLVRNKSIAMGPEPETKTDFARVGHQQFSRNPNACVMLYISGDSCSSIPACEIKLPISIPESSLCSFVKDNCTSSYINLATENTAPPQV